MTGNSFQNLLPLYYKLYQIEFQKIGRFSPEDRKTKLLLDLEIIKSVGLQ